MKTNLREEQIDFLQKIKLIFSSVQPNMPVETQLNTEVSKLNDPKVDNLLKRIEKLEETLGETEDEGIRKGKIKDQTLALLQQHKKLTSSQLSNLIGLSRTRCSEYFRELTREGRTEGVIINRQKYYKLVIK
jgi:response regulator of citrate/malate metabolism